VKHGLLLYYIENAKGEMTTMDLISHKLIALILATGFVSTSSFAADTHGHVTITDREGNHIEADDSDSDEDDSHDSHCWGARHEFYDEDEDDPTDELEEDAAWPSRRENFSEMFR
jgi:hypothetical protein